jgi:hypothetical protein
LKEEFKKKLPQLPLYPIEHVYNPGNKAGPNGPSILTAHYDAVTISRDNPELMNSIEFFNQNLQVPENFLFMGIIGSGSKDVGPQRESKLAFLSEGGAKTRVVAIGDYWSQQALKALHKAFMEMLRCFETDGT